MKQNDENRVVTRNNKPHIILNESCRSLGRVTVEEAKRLAYQIALSIKHTS